MKQFNALTKVLFKEQFRVKPQKGKKKGGMIALYIVLAICILPLVVSVCALLYNLGKASIGNSDSTKAMLVMLMLVCQFFVLMFGIPMVITNIFAAKDGDKLLFLPMKSSVLFSSKFTVVYAVEVATTVIVAMFTILPFAIGARLGFAFYITFLFSLLLIPTLPLLLGTLLAIPISILTRRFGSNAIVKTVLQVVLFVGTMALTLVFMQKMNNFAENPDFEEVENVWEMFLELFAGGAAGFVKYMFPLSFFATAMTATTAGGFFGNFFLGILVNLVLFAIILAVSIPTYRKTLSSQLEHSGNKGGKVVATQVKAKGSLRQLMATDMKRTMRHSQLSFQVIVGLIMSPIMMIIMSVSMNFAMLDEVINTAGIEYQLIAGLSVFAFMLLFSCGINILGLYPISRERRAFAVLKTLPVQTEKILLSKVLLSLIFTLISNVVGIIFVIIFMRLNWYVGLLMLVLLTLFGFGTNCMTTLFDIRSPNLDWTNFNTSLKNAKNSFMGMLIAFALMVVLALIAVPMALLYFSQSNALFIVLMLVAMLAIAVIFAIVTYRILAKKGVVAFNEIE